MVSIAERGGPSSDEFCFMGKLLSYDLFKTDRKGIDDIRKETEGQFVDMGRAFPIEEDSAAYTHGANPCIAGAAITREGVAIFHSLGADLTKEIIELLDRTTTGIVGGGDRILGYHEELLLKRNFQIIYPSDVFSQFPFAIAIVRGRISTFSPGIYYSYYPPSR
jgi:hypothetical protein